MDGIQNQLERLENLELAKQEQKLPASGDTQNLSVALESEIIRKAPLEDIKQVLRYAMMKIGLRAQNWPSDAEKGVLIEHIWKEYGGHAIEEIKLAFDMAIAGKLDVEVNCYENFSCLYFSNIMAAYRGWAKEEHKQLPAPVLIEGPKESMSDDSMAEWLDSLKKEAHAGTIRFAFIPIEVYKWLVSKGELKMPRAKKAEYLQQAVAYRKSLYLQSLEEREDPEIRARLRAFTTMIETGEITGDEIAVVEGITRRKILLDHLFSLPV